MYKTRNNRNERNCRCPCHCGSCTNDEINNKSDIISNINTQNPNSDFQSSSFNNFPVLGRNDFYNLTYDSDLTNKHLMRSMKLRERAQSLKDKINSKFFIESINNNRGNRWNKSYNNFNNLDNNFIPKILRYPLNKSISTLLQNRFGNDENQVLKNLLSKIPRHDKSPYSAKSYIDKLKLSFSNGVIGNKSYNFKPYLSKANQGYTSVVMPPNDLEDVIIRNNANN